MSPVDGMEQRNAENQETPELVGVPSVGSESGGITPSRQHLGSALSETPANVASTAGQEGSVTKVPGPEVVNDGSAPEVTDSGFIKGNGDPCKASFWRGFSGIYTWSQ